MSIQFNDTTNRKGLVQFYEKEIGARRGLISGDSNLLKDFTADVNVALDDYLNLAIKSSGNWQFDDSNQTDYPMIKTNLISGQRSYVFTVDETDNLILDIYRVMVADSAGVFKEISPIDQQTYGSNTTSFYDGKNNTGKPETYDKTANGIFLDPIPNYSLTNGLKIFINRETTYFTSSATTKKPGVPGIHHKYFYLKPALEYVRRNSLGNYSALSNQVSLLEEEIKKYFGLREKDVKKRLSFNVENNK